MTFETICMMFTMQEPYYGILLSSMERLPSQKTNTMAVGRSGNVFKLYYNPKFVESLDLDTTLLCLKHEVLHVALSHFTLWEEENVPPDIHQLRNIALDMEVNGYIDTNKMKGVDPILAKDMGWENYLGGREYFRRLMELAEQKQQEQQANQPQQPCSGGLGGDDEEEEESQPPQPQQPTQPTQQNAGSDGLQESDEEESDDTSQTGNPSPASTSNNETKIPQEFLDEFEQFDDHSMWPQMDEDEKEQMQQVIDDLLVFAAEEVEKGHGTVPGEIAGRITDIRNKKKPKPVADWKRYFRRYLGNEFSDFIRKSKKRESKRFPGAAGNRHRRKSHILVAIDTSGSVSMPEYREFFGQIKTLTNDATFHVVECDVAIQHEYDYSGRPNETLHGGGGTDFAPVTKYFNERRRIYDALVYFTDGYSDIPKDTPKDTLWVISSDGDQSSRKRYQVNGASVAFIPKKQ